MAYQCPPSVLYHHCRPYGVQKTASREHILSTISATRKERALVADKLWDIAAMLPEVGTVPYGRCCGRGGLSRCGFPIVSLAEMEAAKKGNRGDSKKRRIISPTRLFDH